MQQTHGKVETFQPTTLDQIWGDDGTGKYGMSNVDKIIDCIQTTGSIASSINDAREKTEFALHSIQSLDNNSYKEALTDMAEIILHRTY